MVPWSAYQVDETCKLGKEADSKRKEGEEEMKILILTGLVIIIVILAFIALMVFIIGHNIDKRIAKIEKKEECTVDLEN